MILLIFLLMQIELDLNGSRFTIADVPNAIVYDYSDNPKVVYIKLDHIFKNGFEVVE